MEYQKIANLLDNMHQINHLNLEQKIEINDESRGGHTTGSDIKFKTTMLRSSLCHYDILMHTYLLREQ